MGTRRRRINRAFVSGPSLNIMSGKNPACPFPLPIDPSLLWRPESGVLMAEPPARLECRAGHLSKPFESPNVSPIRGHLDPREAAASTHLKRNAVFVITQV